VIDQSHSVIYDLKYNEKHRHFLSWVLPTTALSYTHVIVSCFSHLHRFGS